MTPNEQESALFISKMQPYTKSKKRKRALYTQDSAAGHRNTLAEKIIFSVVTWSCPAALCNLLKLQGAYNSCWIFTDLAALQVVFLTLTYSLQPPCTTRFKTQLFEVMAMVISQISNSLLWLLFSYLLRCTGAQQTVDWEVPRYDGWYNNLAHHSMGSKGSKLFRLMPASYSDGVYQVSPDLPNAREISKAVSTASPESSPSPRNLTVLAVFFGYHVLSEIVSTEMTACPAEFLNLYIPSGDPVFDPQKKGDVVLPFQRKKWSHETGKSPNSPREQINTVTAWLDGSSIYGPSHSWSDALRSFTGGKLASGSNELFPPYTKKSLPMFKVPDPATGKTGNEGIYSFGSGMANESPFRQAVDIVWYRYHNNFAEKLSKKHPEWSDEDLFQNTRKWVTAIYQNIAFYEWLPTFLTKTILNYKGYNQYVDPSVSNEFVALAAQMIYTMMPSAVILRNKQCHYVNVTGFYGDESKALRMCNNYWSRENPNLRNPTDIDHLLLGMALQIAEKEDHDMVSDLQDYWYGLVKYSRTDLLATSILHGRDMGLPEYNKVRRYFELPPLTWANISNSKIKQELSNLYGGDIERLELIPGALLEMNGDPGQIIPEIILNQFYRIRDGDRFWFENTKNGLFTEEEVREIQSFKFHDVLSSIIDAEDALEKDVFVLKQGDKCQQSEQIKVKDLESCVPLQVTDYFEGCALGFGFSIFVLCCFPVVSLLLALAATKSRKRSFIRMKKLSSSQDACHQNIPEGIPASEWSGHDEPLQPVYIQFKQDQIINVVSGKTAKTRTIDLRCQQPVHVSHSSNARSRLAQIKIPKEYDLVLFFDTKEDQDSFLQQLKERLAEGEISSNFYPMKEKDILKISVSKKQRQEMLEVFFRHCVSHVLEINKADAGVIHDQEIARDCALSREELAESLGLNPSAHFVESMFSWADKDCDGYLSFKEFCYILADLFTGSVEDKLKFMFSMHVNNRNGLLTKEALAGMLRSFKQFSSFLSKDQTEIVIDSMLREAGFPAKENITWEEFYAMFRQHSNILTCLTLPTQGLPASVTNQQNKNRQISFISRGAEENVIRNSENNRESNGQDVRRRHGKRNGYTLNQPDLYTTARRQKYESSKFRQKIQEFKRFIENYRRHIVCMVIFFGISAGLFAERSYYYGFASPLTGIADATYIGLIVSRGSAASISFMFSYILLTMCRNLITFLRETFLNRYIPFDSAVDFHRLIAMCALVLAILHSLGHLVNVYIFTITPLSVLSCLFPSVFENDGSEFPNKYYWWFFESVPGLTGILLLAVMALMYVFSTHYFRQFSFRAFWVMHHLYVIFYILTIIHGSFALIQQPRFHIFFLAPALIFVADKLISFSRKKVEIEVLDVKLLPSDVTCLKFRRPSEFDYKSGQWVRIACLCLGTNEYHPFTLTSAPHEDTLSLHIRAVGPWTTRLRELYASCKENKYPKLFLDGPFGEGHQEWNKFEVSVLVGGGIGVTPFASILKDLVFKSSVNAKIHCKKVYFIWVTRTQKQFEWLTDIIREVEEKDKNDILSVHIYITQLNEKFDFRTAMLYICERHFQGTQNQSLLTGLRSVTHFGRPPFVKFFDSLQNVHPKVKKIGVFSCGPPGMTKNVEDACRKLNKKDESHFIHHYENF
ncbi:dual oxidase 1-like [Gastrophryne carolinensis]